MNDSVDNSITSKTLLCGRVEILDGFRGMAILLVIAYHYVPSISFGWIGVDLFFLLSGFLITGKLVESFSQKQFLKKFYWHRMRRIMPLYLLVLLLFFVLLPIFFPAYVSTSFSQLQKQQWSYWTFTINCLNALTGWTDNITLVHFWSLACEIQFYILWPLVVKLIIKNSKATNSLLILFIVFAFIFRLLGNQCYPFNNIYRYVLLPSRIDAFAAGALLYWTLREGKAVSAIALVISVIALVVALWWMLLFRLPWHFGMGWVSKFGLCLNTIFWSGIFYYTLNKKESMLYRFFCSNILKFFGKYSYGLYVWHLPVLFVITRLFSTNATSVQEWGIVLFAFGGTLLCCYVSYHLLEKQFLKIELFK